MRNNVDRRESLRPQCRSNAQRGKQVDRTLQEQGRFEGVLAQLELF